MAFTRYVAQTGDEAIHLGVGTQAGVDLAGRYAGELRVRGAPELATLTTGENEGTAGALTGAAQLYKPTDAADWTVNDLVGRFLRITGGGGYDADRLTLRPIRSNTSTSLTVDTIAGMDATTTFEIVALSGLVDRISSSDAQAVRVSSCSAPVVLEGLAFSGAHALDGLVEVSDCADVLVTGCLFDANTVQASVLIQRCGRVRFEHCVLTDSADVEIAYCANVEVAGVVNDAGGQVWVHDGGSATVTALVATDSPSTVLRLERLRSGVVNASASDGGATPFYLESVDDLEAIVTGSGSTGYGVEIQGGGRYVLTGSTVAGLTGDVLFFDNATTWAILSGTDYGRVESHAGNATARAASTKSIVYGNRLFDGSLDVSGRLLLYGYLNVSSNLTVPTFSGAESYDMGAQGVRGCLECVCNSASAEVLLPDGAAIAGVVVAIVNRGSATLTVKPPVGGSINGGASTTIASNASKTFVSLNGSGGKAFWVLS